jgi:hypothetical protein
MSSFTTTAGGKVLGGVCVQPVLVGGALSLLGPMQRPFQLFSFFLNSFGAQAAQPYGE